MKKYIIISSILFLLAFTIGFYSYNQIQQKENPLGKQGGIPIISLDCKDSCDTFEGLFNYAQTTVQLSQPFTQEGVAFILKEEIKN